MKPAITILLLCISRLVVANDSDKGHRACGGLGFGGDGERGRMSVEEGRDGMEKK